MILFLCTSDFLTRERRWVADALKSRSSVVCIDRLFNSATEIMEALGDEKPSLALYPDIPTTYLPLGVHELNFPTACFQIDAYSALSNRAGMSRLFDLTLVFHPSYVSTYAEAGHPGVQAFPHAIPAEEYSTTTESKQYDVSTVGRLDGPDYAYRRATVDRLRALDVTTNDMERYYPYDEMVETYARSRITVNVGRGDHLHEAHLSCLEIMGAGTLLLTTREPDADRPHELEALGFSEGEHFATFGTLDELQRKVQYYLEHQAERMSMATRARDHTLREHTYDRRAEKLLKWIEEGIPPQAPARSMKEGDVASIYVDYFSKRGEINESLRHLRRQRKAGSSSSSLLRSVGKTAKATIRGWQRALLS